MWLFVVSITACTKWIYPNSLGLSVFQTGDWNTSGSYMNFEDIYNETSARQPVDVSKLLVRGAGWNVLRKGAAGVVPGHVYHTPVAVLYN